MKNIFAKKKVNNHPYRRNNTDGSSSETEEIGKNSETINLRNNSAISYTSLRSDNIIMAHPEQQLLTLTLNPLKYIEKLPSFDGRREDLYTFLANVDGIIPTLDKYDPNSQLMCMNLLKSKFIGKAKRCIEIHAHLIKWIDIKNLLIANFGGFKSSLQLYDQLRQTPYKNNVIEFYNEVQKNLCELNQKTIQENKHHEIANNNQTALEIFKEKLPVYMRTVLFSLKPSSLQEALHELTQARFIDEHNPSRGDYDRNYSKPQHNSQKSNNQQNQNTKPHQNNNFQRNNNNVNTNYKGRNYDPNYKPPSRNLRPTPMEVDPTSSQLRRAQIHHNDKPKEDFSLVASDNISPLLN